VVSGNLTEPVIADVIGPEDDLDLTFDQWGIDVAGNITADISVLDRVDHAAIRAADIDADIFIANRLRGIVQATDGDINRLTVGSSSSSTSGLWGVQNNASQDRRSMISATSIGDLYLANIYAGGENTPPVIYADEIGTLTIGQMHWGEIREDPSGPQSSHAPFVVFGTADIARTYTYAPCDPGLVPCPVLHARIWCESFERFDIAGDHGGEILLSHLPQDRTLRIGGDLYAFRYQVIDDPPSIGYTRNVHDAIGVRDDASLAGCVIINADGGGSPSYPYHGFSVCNIATASGSLPLAYGTTNPPTDLPEYTTPSGPLGGGAVGIAPFFLYHVDCDPPHAAALEDSLLQSQFANYSSDSVPTVGVKMRFYGPVRTDYATANPVELWFIKVLGEFTIYEQIPDEGFIVTMKRGSAAGFSRELEIHGSGDYVFCAGDYLVIHRTDDTDALYCDQLFNSAQPAPAPGWVYAFSLRLDCDSDGEEDTREECIQCQAADYNQDGGVDGPDIEAFFIDWEAGLPAADVNQDGGVDGGDVQTFFIAWEAGGC
jgi:hypothetical protein